MSCRTAGSCGKGLLELSQNHAVAPPEACITMGMQWQTHCCSEHSGVRRPLTLAFALLCSFSSILLGSIRR